MCRDVHRVNAFALPVTLMITVKMKYPDPDSAVQVLPG